ncbi:MAG: trypsin-like peptidase domain-containing protein [Bacteriovoracaceae bacterium]
MRKAIIGLGALIYTSLTLAGPQVIIPSKAIDHLFYLYKDYSVVDNEVKVTGQNFTRTGPNQLTHDEKGHKATIPFSSFSFYRYLGGSVFRAQTGGGGGAGTASLVGKNLVLTNQHVLATDNKKKECRQFEIYLDDQEKHAVTCKRVLYCDVQDFCLAEMNQYNGKDLSDLVRPLSLKSTQETKSKKLLIVGNAYGLGIQGSTGKDYRYVKKGSVSGGYYFDENVLVHHTPTLSGSSGSPVFNEQGEVVGLNYANSSVKGFVDNNAYNMAVPSSYIVSQLKKNLEQSDYKSLSIDQKIASNTISTYNDQLKENFEISNNIHLEQELIIGAIEKNDLKVINEEIKQQSLQLIARLDQFSKREIDYLGNVGSVKAVSDIININNIMNDFNLKYTVEKQCLKNKDITLECKQDLVLKKLEQINLFNEINKQDFKKIINKRVGLYETTAYDILNAIRDDKILHLKMFKGCIEGLKTIQKSDDIVFFENSSSIYYENTKCQETMMNTIRESGLRWTASIKNSEAASLIGSNTDIATLARSFESMVGTKWKFGFLGRSGTKAEKVAQNKALIAAWLRLLPEVENVDEWFSLLNPKMRKNF